METINRLEMLSESIRNEVDELNSLFQQSDNFLLKRKVSSINNKVENIISNLESANDGVYGVFEDANVELGDTEKLREQNEVMANILGEILTHEDKVYLRVKYDIDMY